MWRRKVGFLFPDPDFMLIHAAAAEDKNNKLMSSEGMEATEQEILESFDDNDEDAVLDPVDGADIYD